MSCPIRLCSGPDLGLDPSPGLVLALDPALIISWSCPRSGPGPISCPSPDTGIVLVLDPFWSCSGSCSGPVLDPVLISSWFDSGPILLVLVPLLSWIRFGSDLGLVLVRSFSYPSCPGPCSSPGLVLDSVLVLPRSSSFPGSGSDLLLALVQSLSCSSCPFHVMVLSCSCPGAGPGHDPGPGSVLSLLGSSS
jgi:hypothetical protein